MRSLPYVVFASNSAVWCLKSVYEKNYQQKCLDLNYKKNWKNIMAKSFHFKTLKFLKSSVFLIERFLPFKKIFLQQLTFFDGKYCTLALVFNFFYSKVNHTLAKTVGGCTTKYDYQLTKSIFTPSFIKNSNLIFTYL